MTSNIKLSQLLWKNRYGALRLFAILVTILVLVLHHQMPAKTLTIIPNPASYPGLYGPNLKSGEPSYLWIDEASSTWRCNNETGYPYSCGYSLSLSADHAEGFDFTQYSQINLNLRYAGTKNSVRFSLRNTNPAYMQGNNVESAKFMSVMLQTSDLDRPIAIKLSELTVAEWWLKDFNIPREHAAPELDNIISLAIDFVSEGDSTIQVKSIELEGAWVSAEQLYFSILAFWLAVILWESISKFLDIYRRYNLAQKYTEQLVEDYKQLEKTKEKYETLSTTDILTGVLNRAGISEFLSKLFDSDYEKSQLGLVMFDIDFFKHINDTNGHDCGDRVLKELTKVVQKHTRKSDLLGRWGGEEFILICPMSSHLHIQTLAAKIRQAVEEHTFEPNTPIHVTISIGATMAKQNEPFEKAFKRLDDALYAAKHQGRNKAVCA